MTNPDLEGDQPHVTPDQQQLLDRIVAATEAAHTVHPGYGALLIVQERIRQQTEEGFDAARDDAYRDGELALAAIAYATHAHHLRDVDAPVPDLWPWPADWWKPTDDHLVALAKAGALLAAELDRLLRLRMYESEGRPDPSVQDQS